MAVTCPMEAQLTFSDLYFNIVSYGVNDEGYLDYDQVERLAVEHKPKLILAGASAYAREIDFKKFREIADKVGAYLMVDMAHIAGLVAAGEHMSPIPYADVVTTTTHKTLRGPRRHDPGKQRSPLTSSTSTRPSSREPRAAR